MIKKNSLSPLVYETEAVLPRGSHGQGVVYTLSSKPKVGVLAVSVWGRLWHLGATSLLPASSCELKEWLLCNYAWHSSHRCTVCLEPSAHPWTSWGPTAKCKHRIPSPLSDIGISKGQCPALSIKALMDRMPKMSLWDRQVVQRGRHLPCR